MEERPQPASRPTTTTGITARWPCFSGRANDWQRWNAALQAELLARQRWDGTAAGSYDPDDLWGGYGGRVYSTALATLSLEVYYRYLPVHGRDLDDSRLTVTARSAQHEAGVRAFAIAYYVRSLPLPPRASWPC